MSRYSAGGAKGRKRAKARPQELVDYERADSYRIMRAKFLHDGFAQTQIDSFNDFVNVKIPKCLSEHPPVVVVHEHTDTEHIVEVLGVRFDRPSVCEANGEHRYITPHECHIRRLTYQFNMLITARYMIRQRSTGKVQHSVNFRDKVFDRIPCMKFSEFCTSQVNPEGMMEDEAECGGYFISTGAEKVVIGQEGPRTNYPFVTQESDGSLKCECRSFNEIKYRSTSTLYINLSPPYVTESMDERRTCVPRITVRIPFVSDALPLPVTFKLLEVTSPEAMIDYICVEDDPSWFRARVTDVLLYNVDAVIMKQEHVVTRLAHDRGQPYTSASRRKKGQESLASKRRRKRQETETELERSQKQVAGLISTEFLPHQGYAAENVDAKAVLFGMYVRKLLRVYYGLEEIDSRDQYPHRRVAMTSTLMTLLFRKHWTMWRRRLASQIRRDLDNGAQFVTIKDLLRANIGGHLQTALSTGNFSMQRGQNNMDGVGQVLSRTEPHSAVSHINRTSNPMNKDGRAIAPRLQDPSIMGIICPWATPEGQSCGLMRNKSPMAGVRVGYPNDVLIDAVMSTGMVDAEGRNKPLTMQKNCPVLVSGTLIGVCNTDPGKFLDLLRARRAVQDLPMDVSIYRTSGTRAITPSGEIHVNGDPGSYWWPLLRVDRMHEMRDVLDHITNEDHLWTALLTRGIVEIINKDEEVSAVRVALSHNQLVHSEPGTYTHMVIHPSQICSVFTSRGPLLEFNQAPRVTYNAAMGKQAIGRKMTNSKYRVDTASHNLWHPQRALVSTLMDDVLSPDGVCSVQNPTVAILCNGGYNIEDSLIFNRASIERGLFRSSVVRTTRDVVRKSENEFEELGIPPESCRSKLHANYDKINPKTGTVDPGTQLSRNDVTISKFVHMIKKSKTVDEHGETVEVEEDRIRDRSTTIKTREDAVVDDVIFSKTLEGDTTIRVKTRAMRTPEVGDKFACLSSGHDVLTQSGWVPIEAITLEHRVACMDKDKMTMQYKHPTHVHKYDNCPTLFSINSRGNFCQDITPNHRMALYDEAFGCVELLEAQHVIMERGRVTPIVAAVGGFVGEKGMPSSVENFLAKYPSSWRLPWIYLMGLMSRNFIQGPGRICTSIFMGAAFNDFMHELVSELELTVIRGENQWQIISPFDGIIDAGSGIPEWALRLGKDEAYMFLTGAMARKRFLNPLKFVAHMTIYNDNNERDLLMQLAVHAGLQSYTDATQRFVQVIYEPQVKTTVTADSIQIVQHNAPVYCVSIPPSEIFCVRRRGVVSWTGNSRYGQKGTIGDVYSSVDMPFNPTTGISPDIIMNPHAISSRMTIGHIIEKLMGKGAALTGEQADGTPFTVSEDFQHIKDHDEIIKRLGAKLEEFGYDCTGEEPLVDGRTGEVMKMKVYMGPMSYQKLKHMVEDKYHARSRGPKQMQTQQPVEGRHRDGGQRFGEMERDNLISHGATALLQERLLFSSDRTTVPVCTQCGEIAQPPKQEAGSALFQASVHANKPFCHKCLSHEGVTSREMPYAYKLSVQELQALHLRSGFKFKTETE